MSTTSSDHLAYTADPGWTHYFPGTTTNFFMAGCATNSPDLWTFNLVVKTNTPADFYMVNSQMAGYYASTMWSQQESFYVQVVAAAPPVPVLQAPQRSGNSFSVQVATSSGFTYYLEYTTNLTAPTWNATAQTLGNGTIKTLTDTTATDSWRVLPCACPVERVGLLPDMIWSLMRDVIAHDERDNNMKKYSLPKILAIVAFLTATASVRGQTTVLDFDDGSNGAYIGDFYGASGVIFSNAYWFPNVSCNTGQPLDGASPGPFAIDRLPASSNGNCPQVVEPTSPIIAMFSSPVTNVRITALDIGDAGARVDAYDAVVGGNLVASNEVYGGGIGVSDFFILTNNAALIRRVEFYQPTPNGSDGILFDTLTCSPSPLISPVSLGISASGMIAIRSHQPGLSNRIEYAPFLDQQTG